MAVQVADKVTAAIPSSSAADTAAVAAPPPSSSMLQNETDQRSSAATPSSATPQQEELPLLLRIILTDPDDDQATTNTTTTNNNNLRDLSLTQAVSTLSTPQLLTQLSLLDTFRRSNENNLYQRVRALFFLYAVHRFHLPERRRLLERRRKNNDDVKEDEQQQEENGENNNGKIQTKDATFICPKGYGALTDRRFDEAIDHFLKWVNSSSSTMKLSMNEEEDCTIVDLQEEGTEGGMKRRRKLLYPVPRMTSLMSNLTFCRDGPLPVVKTATTTTAADSSIGSIDTKSSASLLSRGYSSSIASFVSEDGSLPTTTTTTTTAPKQQQQQAPLLLPSEATSSALAKSYRSLAFQTLADQVKRSVRSHDGNEWMFNVRNVEDVPLSWSEDLLMLKGTNNDSSPILTEKTPVRMDLSHVSLDGYCTQ